MYLFYILCSGPSISITRVGWARNNAVFQVSLSVGSLKVLDGEWDSALKDPLGKHNNPLVYRRA